MASNLSFPPGCSSIIPLSYFLMRPFRSIVVTCPNRPFLSLPSNWMSTYTCLWCLYYALHTLRYESTCMRVFIPKSNLWTCSTFVIVRLYNNHFQRLTNYDRPRAPTYPTLKRSHVDDFRVYIPIKELKFA